MKRCAYISGLLVVAGVMANAASTVPYSEDFESYAAGFEMPGTNGWSAAASSDAVVSTNIASVTALNAYSELCGYPGGITSHTKLLEIVGTVTNSFTGSSQQVWVDMMLQPGALASADAGLPSSANAAFYFNASGHPMVYHYDVGGSSNRWTEIPETTKTDWVRATTGLDYATEYFQIKIDGNLLTNALANTAHDGTGASGGSWFKMPDSSGQLNQLVFSGGGGGDVDDLIVALVDPFSPIISSFEHVSGDVFEMVVDFPVGNLMASPSSFSPIKSTDLVAGSWGSTTHSTNGVDGWLDTDMDYSVGSGSSRTIYLQSTDPATFFALEDN
ncbi:MAG: hypothetical protein ABFR47_10035 [Verrucomicrobiota bacterium]